MLRKAMHVLLGTIFVVSFGIQASWAVSFGKMDIASKMGEPFYAEVPLRLNDNETLRKTSVELGSAADYRILEVYRNAVLNAIRTDIVDDERGVRVTLSSDAAIDEAFFNVVLKVRYGRSTHYKKIPVFLDVPAISVTESAPAKPVSAVNAATVDPTSSSAFITKNPEGLKPEKKEAFEEVVDDELAADENAFNAYDGWARTAKYGPMVYGDTITTVAKRLRLDDTFTNKQVMVALFEKNKAQFSNNNINLIKAGAFLDVPSANEVGQVSPSQAKQFLSEQNKAWKSMQKNSKYAALAEAQRTRYSSRVRIGQQATGVATQPSSKQVMGDATVDEKQAANASVAANDDVSTRTAAVVKNLERKLVQKGAAFTALQEKMASLEAQLAQTNIDEKGSVLTGQPAPDDATTAAIEAQNKRLELVITRLKTQLEQAKTNVNQTSGDTSWMLYALIGLAVLVLSLLIAVLMLLKRGRQHPAEKDVQDEDIASADEEAEEEQDLDATRLMDADEFDMPSEDSDDTGDASELDASSAMFGEMDGDLEEIPDLTDEETGEMEPFNADEAPDPNVNYLEDADVYLRYGMEDEAEQQVRMALKLEQDNPEAHAKMVKIQKAKGDDTAMNEAIAAAKVVLTGGALTLFETAIADEDSVLEQSEEDLSLGDLPSAAVEEVDANDIDVGSIDFDSNVDVALEEESASSDDGEIDFDFSDIGKGEESIDAASDVKDDDLPDLDIDFDIADLGDEQEIDETPSVDGKNEESHGLISAELDEVDVEGLEASDIEEFVDGLGEDAELSSLDDDDDVLGVDSIDFGDMDLGETSEVQLENGTQLISTDGFDLDSVDGLNDFELDKLQSEAEAEKNATSVDVDESSADPFLDANQALEDKGESEAGEDWDAESIGLLVGEEEDALSLLEEKKEKLEDDGTADIKLEDLDIDKTETDTVADESENIGLDDDIDADVSLNDLDMDFDLPDLDTEEAVATDSTEESGVDLDVSMNASEDIGLDDLDMDFDLPDLDGDVESTSDDTDATFVMDAGDSGETDADESGNIGLDDDVDADVSLDDLDMDFDLPDLDTEEEVVTDSTEESGVDLDVSMDAGEDISLDDLDMDFDLPDLDNDVEPALDDADSTFIMDADGASDDNKTEDAADTDISLNDLDMDFDLPDLDAEETVATDSTEESGVDLDVSMDAGEDISLDDLDMDFDLPDLDAEETVVADSTEESGVDLDVSMDAGEDIGLDDLDMDFDLPDLDGDVESTSDDELIDLDASPDREESDDILLLDTGDESIDSIDTGLDDLDISTTTVDPVRLGLDNEDTDLDISLEVEDDELGLLADLDADLSELEMHEESIISDVSKLASKDDVEDLDISELKTADVMLDEADDLDKTFVLNDVEKNKAMLKEGEEEASNHFENIDDALAGASSVGDDEKDPMLDAFSSTEELENIHTQNPMDTGAVNVELDSLLSDLDGLLDEDKDKK